MFVTQDNWLIASTLNDTANITTFDSYNVSSFYAITANPLMPHREVFVLLSYTPAADEAVDVSVLDAVPAARKVGALSPCAALLLFAAFGYEDATRVFVAFRQRHTSSSSARLSSAQPPHRLLRSCFVWT